MVSIRYLLGVGEASFWKFTLSAAVASVNWTSATGEAATRKAAAGRAGHRKRWPARRKLALIPADTLSFLDYDDLIGWNLGERFFRSGGPEHFDFFGGRGFAQAEMKAQIVVRIIAGAAHHLACLRDPARQYTDARANCAAVRARSHTFYEKPVVSIAAVIAQQGRGGVQIVDHDIDRKSTRLNSSH